MKLRVGFSTTNGLVSKIIRWFTGSTVSHSYIRVDDRFLGTPLVFHADYPGVVILHAPLFDARNIAIEEYEIDDERFIFAIKKNLYLLGKQYDYPKLLGFVPLITFRRWLKRKIQNPIEDPKKLICVDFVLRITNDAGVTDLPLGVTAPEELRKWFSENCQIRKWRKIVYEI